MEAQESLFPNLLPRLIGLEELAENLWWSWHPRRWMLIGAVMITMTLYRLDRTI